MKITRKQKVLTFKELHTGDVFTLPCSTDYYMRIHHIMKKDEIDNAVSLSEGVTSYFKRDEVVIALSAELIVSPMSL